MMKTFAGALAVAGAVLFVAPSAQAASVDGASTLTQELSAQTTVRTRTVVRNNGNTRVKTTTRTRSTGYSYPSYYGYYGPTYYSRPYARPPAVTFGIGGWW